MQIFAIITEKRTLKKVFSFYFFQNKLFNIIGENNIIIYYYYYGNS